MQTTLSLRVPQLILQNIIGTFGYFGAARDYLSYDLSTVASKYSVDSNGDGAISLQSEKNTGLSINAAKRQLGAAGQDVDFVFEAMDAFLKGRHLISTEAGNAELLRAQAVRALGAFLGQTIAATTIHYINKTVKELGEWGTDAYLFKDHVKFWGEMKVCSSIPIFPVPS